MTATTSQPPTTSLSDPATGLRHVLARSAGERRGTAARPVAPPVLIARLLIGHPSRLTGEVMAATLAAQPEIAEVRLVHGLSTIAEAVSSWHPTLVLLAGAQSMTDLDLATSLSRQPHLRGVVIVTAEPSRNAIDSALRAGRVSLLSHQASSGQLIHALMGAAKGYPTIDTAFVPGPHGKPCPLTQRERDVLMASLQGTTLRDIAEDLFLAPGTVRNLSSSAIRKLDAQNRHEAAVIAQTNGWL
jgi:two-component system, NarL family, response regulator DesR